MASPPDSMACLEGRKVKSFSVNDADASDVIDELAKACSDPMRADDVKVTSCYMFALVSSKEPKLHSLTRSESSIKDLVELIAKTYDLTVEYGNFVVVFHDKEIGIKDCDKLGSYPQGGSLRVAFDRCIRWDTVDFGDEELQRFLALRMAYHEKFKDFTIRAPRLPEDRKVKFGIYGKWVLEDVMRIYCQLYGMKFSVKDGTELVVEKEERKTRSHLSE
ncbi:MAG: hypothetical protein QM755_24190 [Luteolibacter sp.]